MTQFIGLGAYSRVGKDSLANYLVAELTRLDPKFRVKKIPFAWKLKQIAFDLYAWAGMREPEFYDTPEGAPFRDIVLPGIGKSPVKIWVDLGTPAIRDQVYINTWIDYVLKTDHDADLVIVPDVRFPNETAAMLGLDAALIKVVRPGYGPRKTVADRALVGWDGWNYVVGASGTMNELNWWATQFAQHYVTHCMWPTQHHFERICALAVEVIEP